MRRKQDWDRQAVIQMQVVSVGNDKDSRVMQDLHLGLDRANDAVPEQRVLLRQSKFYLACAWKAHTCALACNRSDV